MSHPDDGHDPKTCNWQHCNAQNPTAPCPFMAADEPPLIADDFEVLYTPLLDIVADIVKNNKDLTPALQDAIAQIISTQTTRPQIIRPSKN